jgi:hypothetical protein
VRFELWAQTVEDADEGVFWATVRGP